MFPNCSNLGCIISQCPEGKMKENCCEWILGHGLLSGPGYFKEDTSNYVTFSRQEPCDPSEQFSQPGCPDESWDRWKYHCYKLINEDTSRSYSDSLRDCSQLGARLVAPVPKCHIKYGGKCVQQRKYLTSMMQNVTDNIWIRELTLSSEVSKTRCINNNATCSLVKQCKDEGKCRMLSVDREETCVDCDVKMAGVCVRKNCDNVDCCKMTREEAWSWQRRVQGRSIVLRPDQIHVDQPWTISKGNIINIVAIVIFCGNVLWVIGVRMWTRKVHERRYREYNAAKEKYWLRTQET